MPIEIRVPPPSQLFSNSKFFKSQTGRVRMVRSSGIPNGRKLDDKDEAKLAKDAMLYIKCGHNIDSREFISRLGNAKFLDKEDSEKTLREPLGQGWPKRFLERYPKVKKEIDQARSSLKQNPREDCISRLQELINEYDISAENIYAMKPDQGFTRSKSKKSQKVAFCRPNHPEYDDHDLGSAIICISKTGRFLKPYVILKGNKSTGAEPKYKLSFTTNPLGWADGYDFNEWLEKCFEEETCPEIPEGGHAPWRLLIVSHPHCRLDEKFFIGCKQNRIICFSLSIQNAGDLDPFACGVTEYITGKYTDKLQDRWDKRGKMPSIRLKAAAFVTVFGKLTIGGRLEQERQLLIQGAWGKCALFSSSSTSGKVEENETSVYEVAEDADMGRVEGTNPSESPTIAPRSPRKTPLLSSHSGNADCTELPELHQSVDSPTDKPVKTREGSSPADTTAPCQSRSETSQLTPPSQPPLAPSGQSPRPRKRQKHDSSGENLQHAQSSSGRRNNQDDDRSGLIRNPNHIPIPAWPRGSETKTNNPPTAPRAILSQEVPPNANEGQFSRSSPSRERRPERGRNRERTALGSLPPESPESSLRGKRSDTSGSLHGRGPSRSRNDQAGAPDSHSRWRSFSRPRNVNTSSNEHGRSRSRPWDHSAATGRNSRKRSRARSRNDQSRHRNEHGARRRDPSRPSGGATSKNQRDQFYPQRYRPTTPSSSPTRPSVPPYRSGNHRHSQGFEARRNNDPSISNPGNQTQSLQEAKLMKIIDRQQVLLDQMEARLGLNTE